MIESESTKRMRPCSQFHSKLLEIRHRKQYCDVDVRVEDELFSCHRLILATASEYFNAMFSHDFQEKTAQETTLHDINKETFREILESVYTGQQCRITVSNMLLLLQASLFLRINSIQNDCIEFILKNLSSIRDHIQIFEFACSLNITTLRDALSIYIVQNFKSFYDEKRFLEMAYDDLQLILTKWKQDNLPIKCENLLLDLLIRWVHFTPQDRKKYLNELVQVVDFERISPQYISLMLKYLKNLTEIPSYGETSAENLCIIKENELNYSMPKDWSNIQDSQSRWLLKKKIAEYSLKNDYFSSNCVDMTPVVIQNPKSYRDELGLHIYVEYIPRRRQNSVAVSERLKNTKVLSINKYEPDWFISCETDAWYGCDERKMASQESADSFYCLETHKHESPNNKQNFRQVFCTYTSTSMEFASEILTPPPIIAKVNHFNMCAVRNNIYLHNYSERKYDGPTLYGTFSQEELDYGFFRYNCEVDEWFSVPICRSTDELFACLAADNNLLYLLSCPSPSSIVHTFDDRDGKWMKAPSCNFSYGYHSPSCTVNGKLYISNGEKIEYFDHKAGKWNILKSPDIPKISLYGSYWNSEPIRYHRKLLPYENMLWIIAGNSQPNYCTAAYNFISQEWYVSENINKVMSNFLPQKEGDLFYYDYTLKDAIVFKTTVSS